MSGDDITIFYNFDEILSAISSFHYENVKYNYSFSFLQNVQISNIDEKGIHTGCH
jgi:hypothetical protein